MLRRPIICAAALAVAAAVLPARAAAPAEPQRWAVVVGVGAYEDPRIPATPRAVADAEGVRDWLTTTAGVPADHVLMLTDGGMRRLDPTRRGQTVAPSRRNLRVAVATWLPKRAKAGDTVLVFFAGQGATAEGAAPLLLTADATPDDQIGSAVDARWVAAELGKLPGVSAVLWLDTSFRGRGRAWPGELPAIDARALRPGAGGEVWLAASEAVAAESAKGPHGAFSQALLGALRGADGTTEGIWGALGRGLEPKAPKPVRLAAPKPIALGAPKAVGAAPVMVLQTGHSETVLGVTWSPDETLLVSGGADNAARVWDTGTWKLRAVLRGYRAGAPAFSPDGKVLATADGDRGVSFWDPASGRELRRLASPKGAERWYASEVRWSPDGALVTARSDREVRLIRAADYQVLATLPLSGPEMFEDLAFTADGAWLVVGSRRSDPIKLEGGKPPVIMGRVRRSRGVLRFVDLKAPTAPPREVEIASGGVGSPAASPKGPTIAMPSTKGLVLVDAASGKAREIDLGGQGGAVAWTPAGDRVAVSVGGAFRWVDARSGKAMGTLQPAPDRKPRDVARLEVTPDGRTLVAAGTSGVQLWDVASGAEVTPKALTDPRIMRSRALAVAPKTGRLAGSHVSGRGYRVDVWKRGQDQPLALLEGKLERLTVAAVNTPSMRLATASIASLGGYVAVWDLAAGQPVRRFPTGGAWLDALAFSPDGKVLVGMESDGTLTAWDPATGKVIGKPLRSPGLMAVGFAFDRSGRRLALGNPEGVRIWEPATGSVRWLERHEASDLVDEDGFPLLTLVADKYAMAWSADGKRVVALTEKGLAKTFDVASGQVMERNLASRDVDRVNALSADGRLALLAARQPRELWLVEVATGRRVWKASGIGWGGRRLAFAEDGKHVTVAYGDGNVEVRRLSDGTIVQQVTVVGSEPHALLGPKGALITRTDTRGIDVWQPGGSELLANVLSLHADDGWAVTSPNGLFDGSPAGQALVEWRVGDRLFGPSQFYADFYTPGLLARLMRGERPKPRLSLDRVRPPPRVRIVSPSSGTTTKAGKVTVEVLYEDQGGGVSQRWLYLNGHRVPTTTRGAVAVGGEVRRFEVALVEGDNHLRATAFDASGAVESRGAEITVVWSAPARKKPTLHVVAVGVDNYRAGLRLRHARSDARSIAGFFEQGLFGQVRAHVLLDEKASRQGILDTLAAVGKQAAPRDVVLIYLAGHGTLVGQQFLFLPWDVDVRSDEALTATGLSQTALGDAMVGIRATKQLLVLDACHSGATAGPLGAMLARRDALSLIRAQQRLARASGTFLIAASKADQYAKEVPELGHGVLTYALLRALGDGGPPAAAVSADGTVTVNGLMAYLAEAVPDLTARYAGGRQEPVQASTGQDFPLVRVR